MSDIAAIHNIGAFVMPVTSVFPQSSASTTITGASIDRCAHNNAQSCVLHQMVGGDSGSPSAISVQTELEHAPDNATWSVFQINTVTQETAALTAVDSESSVAIDLASADRYIRAATVVALTGGSSPTVIVASDIVLGGESELAAV